MRGGYGIFNYHDEQGPFSGTLDVPAGYRQTTVSGPRAPAQYPEHRRPPCARIDATAHRARRRPAAADAELEPHRAAPAAVEHDVRDVVRRQQERPAAQRRLGQHQHPAVRRRAQRRQRRMPARPFQLYNDDQRHAAQPVLELPLVAEPAEPADGPVQLHRRLHLLEGAGHPRQLAGPLGAAARAWPPSATSRTASSATTAATCSAWPTAGTCRR